MEGVLGMWPRRTKVEQVTMFHVTSSRNRESIRTHGLDYTRMGAAPGIAGSRSPEQKGTFLCFDEFERDWFVRMNNTGGPVDVWAVRAIDPSALVPSPEGHHFLPGTIAATRLVLVQTDIPAQSRW
jgi:hypothetical protein